MGHPTAGGANRTCSGVERHLSLRSGTIPAAFHQVLSAGVLVLFCGVASEHDLLWTLR